jgi:hypothetical protein
MRNTKEYPVDAEEAASLLALCAADFPKELIGDMRPYVLSMVAAFVLVKKDEFDQFVKDNG